MEEDGDLTVVVISKGISVDFSVLTVSQQINQIDSWRRYSLVSFEICPIEYSGHGNGDFVQYSAGHRSFVFVLLSVQIGEATEEVSQLELYRRCGVQKGKTLLWLAPTQNSKATTLSWGWADEAAMRFRWRSVETVGDESEVNLRNKTSV